MITEPSAAITEHTIGYRPPSPRTRVQAEPPLSATTTRPSQEQYEAAAEEEWKKIISKYQKRLRRGAGKITGEGLYASEYFTAEQLKGVISRMEQKYGSWQSASEDLREALYDEETPGKITVEERESIRKKWNLGDNREAQEAFRELQLGYTDAYTSAYAAAYKQQQGEIPVWDKISEDLRNALYDKETPGRISVKERDAIEEKWFTEDAQSGKVEDNPFNRRTFRELHLGYTAAYKQQQKDNITWGKISEDLQSALYDKETPGKITVKERDAIERKWGMEDTPFNNRTFRELHLGYTAAYKQQQKDQLNWSAASTGLWKALYDSKTPGIITFKEKRKIAEKYGIETDDANLRQMQLHYQTVYASNAATEAARMAEHVAQAAGTQIAETPPQPSFIETPEIGYAGQPEKFTQEVIGMGTVQVERGPEWKELKAKEEAWREAGGHVEYDVQIQQSIPQTYEYEYMTVPAPEKESYISPLAGALGMLPVSPLPGIVKEMPVITPIPTAVKAAADLPETYTKIMEPIAADVAGMTTQAFQVATDIAKPFAPMVAEVAKISPITMPGEKGGTILTQMLKPFAIGTAAMEIATPAAMGVTLSSFVVTPLMFPVSTIGAARQIAEEPITGPVSIAATTATGAFAFPMKTAMGYFGLMATWSIGKGLYGRVTGPPPKKVLTVDTVKPHKGFPPQKRLISSTTDIIKPRAGMGIKKLISTHDILTKRPQKISVKWEPTRIKTTSGWQPAKMADKWKILETWKPTYAKRVAARQPPIYATPPPQQVMVSGPGVMTGRVTPAMLDKALRPTVLPMKALGPDVIVAAGKGTVQIQKMKVPTKLKTFQPIKIAGEPAWGGVTTLEHILAKQKPKVWFTYVSPPVQAVRSVTPIASKIITLDKIVKPAGTLPVQASFGTTMAAWRIETVVKPAAASTFAILKLKPTTTEQLIGSSRKSIFGDIKPIVSVKPSIVSDWEVPYVRRAASKKDEPVMMISGPGVITGVVTEAKLAKIFKQKPAVRFKPPEPIQVVKVGEGVVQIQKMKTETKVSSVQKVSEMLAVTTLPKQITKQVDIQKQLQKLRQDTLQLQKTISIQKVAQAQKMGQVQWAISLQKTGSLLKVVPIQIGIQLPKWIIPTITKPKWKILPSLKPSRKPSRRRRKKVPIYQLKIRRKGKWITVGKRLPKYAAMAKGMKITDVTPARSFTLIPAGFAKARPGIKPRGLWQRYRRLKPRTKVKRPSYHIPPVYVEKTKFAISVPYEIGRPRKRRKKRKEVRDAWGNIFSRKRGGLL